MRILQPAEWPRPRGFSHGIEVGGPGRWIVLAGQTGGDEKGDYPEDLAAQVATALKRIARLLAEADAAPEHVVRLTWYLTSRQIFEFPIYFRCLTRFRPIKIRRWQRPWQRPANFAGLINKL